MLKKLLRVLSYILVAVLSSALTIFLLIRYTDADNKLLVLEELIDYAFVEEVDFEALEDAAADAMVQATGDRWSYYIPASYMDTFTENETNSYVGVGITISAQEEGEYYDIMEVVSGGPAEEAGIAFGDVLIAVDYRNVAGMDISEVKKLVRGKAGTPVVLTVERAGMRMDLTMNRASFKTDVALFSMADDTTGYVKIKNFDDRCAEETIAALETLLSQGMERVIIDLRYNPGGAANELVKLLDYFLPEGEIFHTVDFRGEEEFFHSDAACLDIPVAVLINADSYSAAEFFAGAMQEYGRAAVIGEHTSGKGYFQYTYPLGDGSAVALSSGRYYMPSGKSLIGEGLEPDVVCALDDEADYLFYYNALPLEEDAVVARALEVLNAK